MKTITKILVIISIIFPTNGYAQVSREPTVALSPNAASLGLYGEIPVSLYTGAPEISIPLYDIKVKDYTLPISLNYHASGIRVDQRPGWVGLGWSLFAGGVITRSVNDMPDESHNANYYQGANSGYYFNHNVLNTSSWNQRTYLRSVAQSNNMLKDTSPDEFSFNFAGYSGKFYLDHTGNWAIQCNKPIQVKFNGIFLPIPFDKNGTRADNYGYSPCFNGFTILTADGIEYVFGGNTNAIDYSIDFFTQYIADWMATAWYLTKIKLPSQQEITFTYERKEFNNQMYIAVHHDLGSWTESSGGLFNPQPSCSAWNYESISRSYSGKLIAPVYLTEISTDHAVISFTKSISNELNYSQSIYSTKYSDWYNYSTGYPFLPLLKSNYEGYPNCLSNLKWYKLDSIVIQNKAQTETIKTVAFNYTNSSTQRLTLGSVTESGKQSYTFAYNNIENLPDYLANTSDHWGFYNNTYASLNYANYYSYRNPSATYTKYGVLTKISYPTGGYTEFEFEPHYYKKQLNITRNICNTLSANQLAGGVRIKRIKNSDTSNGPAQTIKEYYYVSDYLQNTSNASQSSGVLGGQIQYSFTDYIVYAFNDNNVKRKMSVFSSISVLPACYNSQGSAIGYTEVIEKREDNSFARYQFTNFDNGYMDEPADAIIQLSRTPYEAYASKATDRGNLILQEDYNSTGKKIKSKNILYEKDAASNNYVRAMNARYANVCPSTAVSYDEGTSYKLYTYLLRPQTETVAYYDPDTEQKWQEQIVNYTYNGQKLLRSVTSTNSDGSIRKQELKYPSDFTTSPYPAMVTKNILSPVVETSFFKGTSLIEKTGSDYALQHNTFYAPVNSKYQKGNGNAEIRATYQYDTKGNIKEVVKNDADKVVYLWGYKHQYPVAEIQNATYAQVRDALGGQTAVDAIANANMISTTNLNSINALRTNTNLLSNAQVTTYTYRPLVGILTSTDPRGVITTYNYDAYGRLQAIKDENNKEIENYNYHYKNQ